MAIVHHWLITQGGGERVLEWLAHLYPEADIFTLIADPAVIPLSIRHRHIEQSFLSRIPGSHRFHRHLFALYPLAVEHLDLRGYDLVITSDAGPMKGVIVAPGAVHICYCHAPMRYVWNQYHDYRGELSGLARYAFSVSAHYVRGWDFAAAQRVTLFAANSSNVSQRIRQYYARPSEVLYPPVDMSDARLEGDPGDHYLTVGRLVAYKRIDLVIEACNHLGRKLRIIGTGPEEVRLRKLAGRTIEFLGQVDDQELWDEYAHCRAFVFAAEEDFGMAAVEAQACGRPVIAYGQGGALESVATGSTVVLRGQASGLFFQEQTVPAVCEALQEFERKEHTFDPVSISEWAQRFEARHFVDGFRKLVHGALSAGDRQAGERRARPAPVASIRNRSSH